MIDPRGITDFRNKVDGSLWCRFKYQNNNDKNQWNCICSAMDWIEASANYIHNHEIASLHDIELYAYISSVDIIVEAVEQLHRVIFADNKKTIFADDNDCFLDNPFDQSDRKFFKELRACFGAHPVRLNDPEEPNNKNAKRFASWPSTIGSGDISVILYSNRVGGKSIELGMKFEQLEWFLNKYYSYLTVLAEALDVQYHDFCEQKRHEKFSCMGTPIERLKILKAESQKRLNIHYYNHAIDSLMRVYQLKITNKQNLGLVQEYRNDLLPAIDEIHDNLQGMTFAELKYDDNGSSCDLPLPNGWGYFVEKLTETIHGSGYPECVWLPKLRKIFEDKFVFEYSSLEELDFLIKATVHVLAKHKPV